MLDTALPLIEAAVAERRIPGIALGAVRADGARATAFRGDAEWQPERRPLTPDLAFDLASLTKVLFTVAEVLRLVEDGVARLDDPLGRFLAQLDVAVRPLTLRQMLVHQAGFEPWVEFQTWTDDPARLRERLVRHSWRLGEPVYSDIGYVLLSLALETLRGRPLNDFALPPGLSWGTPPERAVTTEYCAWRGRTLCGEVHDERAAALGGGAGHAGLFGTLDAVLDLALAYLDGSVLPPAALAELRKPHWAERALGWQRRHPDWSGGQACSAETLGHTGFTGTGLWIDFTGGYAWALLSNRVHPSRERDTGIIELRRAVGDEVAQEAAQGAAVTEPAGS